MTEHYRLSQYDRTQAHTEEVQRKRRIQIQSPKYSKLFNSNDTFPQLVDLSKNGGGNYTANVQNPQTCRLCECKHNIP